MFSPKFEIVNIKTGLKAVLGQYELTSDRKTRDHLAWAIERRSHVRGVYPTYDTSRMGTTRVKKEEETDTRIVARK